MLSCPRPRRAPRSSASRLQPAVSESVAQSKTTRFRAWSPNAGMGDHYVLGFAARPEISPESKFCADSTVKSFG